MTNGALIVGGVALAQLAWFAGATWALLVAVGGRATEVQLGVPRWIRWRWGGATLSLGPVPSPAVTIFGRMADEPIRDPHDWRGLSLARRLLVCGAPWLVVFAIAVGCLGARHAWLSFVHGFAQVLFVLDLTPLVRRLYALAASAPLVTTLGVM